MKFITLECLFLIFFSFIYFNVSSQDISRIDSLMIEGVKYFKRGDNSSALRSYLLAKEYLREKPNSNKSFKLYYLIGDVFLQENLNDKALENLNKCLIIKGDTSNEAFDIQLKLKLAEVFQRIKKTNKAIDIYKKLLLKNEVNNSDSLSITIIEALVNCYESDSQYEKAITFEKEILRKVRKIKPLINRNIVTVLSNIGYLYSHLKNYELSFNYFDSAQIVLNSISKEKPISSIIAVNINRAVTYQNFGDNENAINSLKKAKKYISERENKELLLEIDFLLARIYFEMKDMYNAEIYCLNIINNSKTIHSSAKWEMDGLELYSAIKKNQENFEEALDTYKLFLNIKDSLLLEERIRQEKLLQQQVFLEKSEKEIQLLIANKREQKLESDKKSLELEKKQKELENLQQEKKIRDSKIQQSNLLREKERTEYILQVKQLEAVKKQRQIDLLRKNEELQKETITRKELQKKQKEQELKILTNKNELLIKDNELISLREYEVRQKVYFIFLTFLILVILISFYWYTTNKKNKQLRAQGIILSKKNDELISSQNKISAQKEQLENQNQQLQIIYRNIQDSIKYAQRIQSSILVSIDYLEEYLENIFIFFKPRDKVSGDFYWYTQVGNLKFIAAIDCTGHGVPGAFVSLIANDLLNEIIKSKKIIDPGKILTELDNSVQKTLNQDTSQNKDGMDMTLLVLNEEMGEYQFAGAKNPLVYIEQDKVNVIKGDKMSIGGKKRVNGVFKTHHLNLRKGTCLYMFSDGFSDQFGGPDNKKYLIKNFRNFLFDIHSHPLREQKLKIEHEFFNWVKGYKQMDDVLVIGMKV